MPGPDASTPAPLRIGLLGASRIAPHAVLEPARRGGHRVVVVAARDRRRAERYAAEHGIERVAGSYADVMAHPEVEVVYNPLANGLHGPWNLAAIAAGRHVLSEKPFSSDAEEAEEVRDAAATAGVAAVEAFHYVHHPLTRRLEALLGAGELGDLREIEVDMVMPPPPDEDPRWSLELAGGSLMDVGCYALHLARVLGRWAGGAPRVVAATAQERRGHPGVDERLTARLEYPGGATALVRSAMDAPEVRFAFRVVGSRAEAAAGNFVLPHLDPRLTVTPHGREPRVEHLGTRPSYDFQLDALAAHLRTGAPLRTDADDAVEQMRLVDACYLAAGLPLRPRSDR